MATHACHVAVLFSAMGDMDCTYEEAIDFQRLVDERQATPASASSRQNR